MKTMEKVGFIGAYDKSDLILYVARMLTQINKKVLVIDATRTQKMRYTVPVINSTASYVTEFEEIDVAVGFREDAEIKEYLGVPPTSVLDYDYVLVDIDSPAGMARFQITNECKNFFVTSFDLYSLKRGLEIIGGFPEPMNLMKVLFSRHAYKEEDDYLNFLSLGYKVNWNPERIYFPYDQGDRSVMIENQMASKIKLKKMTKQFKASLIYLTGNIATESNDRELDRALRRLERGV